MPVAHRLPCDGAKAPSQWQVYARVSDPTAGWRNFFGANAFFLREKKRWRLPRVGANPHALVKGIKKIEFMVN